MTLYLLQRCLCFSPSSTTSWLHNQPKPSSTRIDQKHPSPEIQTDKVIPQLKQPPKNTKITEKTPFPTRMASELFPDLFRPLQPPTLTQSQFRDLVPTSCPGSLPPSFSRKICHVWTPRKCKTLSGNTTHYSLTPKQMNNFFIQFSTNPNFNTSNNLH